MIHLSSERTRRLIGRLDAGERLVESLTELCEIEGVRGGELRVLGRLRRVEIVQYDAEARAYTPVFDGEGAADIVMLSGNIGHLAGATVLRLDGLVSLRAPIGQQLVSGQIKEAIVESCEFVLDWFEDVELLRHQDPKTGYPKLGVQRVEVEGAPAPAPVAAKPAPRPAAPVAERPAPVAERPAPAVERKPEPVAAVAAPAPAPAVVEKPAASGLSWAEAAQASEDVERADKKPGARRDAGASSIVPAPPSVEEVYGDADFLADLPDMKPGDVADHPKYGKCRIMKIEDDEFIHVRLPNGRISKLSLDFFDVAPGGEDDRGRRVFKLQMSRT